MSENRSSNDPHFEQSTERAVGRVDQRVTPPLIESATVVHQMPLTERARRALFEIAPPAATPVWDAKRYEDREVAAVAAQLFGEVDPHGATANRAILPTVRPYFSPSVLKASGMPLGFALAETVLNGLPFYLQGATHGVGASFLAEQYAEQFTLSAQQVGDGRNAVVLNVLGKIRTLRQLLDALAFTLGGELTATELRFRSPLVLAKRVVAAAVLRRTVCIVIDHVDRLEDEAREAVVGIINLLHPSMQAQRRSHDAQSGKPLPRIGLILVSHLSAEKVFGQYPAVASRLQRHQVLQPYTNWMQVGEALARADIGLADFNPDTPDDEEMARFVLQKTQGLPVMMTPFFARMAKISSHLNVRPNVGTAAAVLPYERALVELQSREREDGTREYRNKVRTPKPSRQEWKSVYGEQHDGRDSLSAGGMRTRAVASAGRGDGLRRRSPVAEARDSGDDSEDRHRALDATRQADLSDGQHDGEFGDVDELEAGRLAAVNDGLDSGGSGETPEGLAVGSLIRLPASGWPKATSKSRQVRAELESVKPKRTERQERLAQKAKDKERNEHVRKALHRGRHSAH